LWRQGALRRRRVEVGRERLGNETVASSVVP
jgi:hypothetical protein